MKSARGVYYDLLESTYNFKYKNITFYFSSQLYLTKFIATHFDYIDYINKKMKIEFNIKVDFSILALIKLYQRIEKRGFRVLVDDHELTDYDIKIIGGNYGNTLR